MLRRAVTVLPVLAIAAMFAAVAVLGFGPGNGKSQQQVRQEVNALLAGIPQEGATLGSPEAPITLWVFGDLECPTVRLFADSYLPSIIDRWVRPGLVKLKYRSLQTDTVNEEIFFEQERAALAAGRQDRMWNFVLTFVHHQGKQFSNYVTDEFLVEVASQVPALRQEQWRRDRKSPSLSRQVALGIYSGHKNKLRYTPSFLLGYGGSNGESNLSPSDRATLKEVQTSLSKEVQSLEAEAVEDSPALRTVGSSAIGG